MLKSIEFTLICTIFFGIEVSSQSQYNARLKLSHLDTLSKVACYNVEIQNGGVIPWHLANYNLGIFYDAAAALYLSDSLLLDDIIYDQSVTSFISSVKGSPLAYEDNLGFLRIGLSSNDFGTQIDSQKTWIPTVQLCFRLLIDDITNPNTCLQMNFVSTNLRNFIAVPPNIVQRSDSVNLAVVVNPNTLHDNRSDRSLNACFVLSENNDELCSDGIDNDEDGKVDCDDSGDCWIGNVSLIVSNPDCLDTLGSLTVSGAASGSVFSLDGQFFVIDSNFHQLSGGSYEVFGRINDVAKCDFFSPFIIDSPNCDEFDDLSCSDGIDNDGDGLTDCNDPDCIPIVGDIRVTGLSDCDAPGDAIIEISSTYSNLRYSIDGSANFTTDSVFALLSAGQYDIVIENRQTTCQSVPGENLIIIDSLQCAEDLEICGDGIDNDNDGLVDCQDQDCFGTLDCPSTFGYYIPSAVSFQSRFNNRFGLTLENKLDLHIKTFVIFDRWGNQVHHIENRSAQDPSHFWNGSYKGKLVPSGVYVYILQFRDSDSLSPIIGSVTVMD